MPEWMKQLLLLYGMELRPPGPPPRGPRREGERADPTEYLAELLKTGLVQDTLFPVLGEPREINAPNLSHKKRVADYNKGLDRINMYWVDQPKWLMAANLTHELAHKRQGDFEITGSPSKQINRKTFFEPFGNMPWDKETQAESIGVGLSILRQMNAGANFSEAYMNATAYGPVDTNSPYYVSPDEAKQGLRFWKRELKTLDQKKKK